MHKKINDPQALHRDSTGVVACPAFSGRPFRRLKCIVIVIVTTGTGIAIGDALVASRARVAALLLTEGDETRAHKPEFNTQGATIGRQRCRQPRGKDPRA